MILRTILRHPMHLPASAFSACCEALFSVLRLPAQQPNKIRLKNQVNYKFILRARIL